MLLDNGTLVEFDRAYPLVQPVTLRRSLGYVAVAPTAQLQIFTAAEARSFVRRHRAWPYPFRVHTIRW